MENTPSQKTGASSDTESEICLNSVSDAVRHFKTVKERLLDVSSWDKLNGMELASFQLMDTEGKEVFRHARKGDYFRIDLPGPGSEKGSGYDWVCIEDVDNAGNEATDEESVAIKVRPAANPTSNETETAHFFREDATSTFIVRRRGAVVSAEVHGRNEKPNTIGQSISDIIRNILFAVGAMLGFSKVQWKGLVNGLIDKN